MRAIAFAIVLGAFFLIPSRETDRLRKEERNIAAAFGLFCFVGFVICVLGGK